MSKGTYSRRHRERKVQEDAGKRGMDFKHMLDAPASIIGQRIQLMHRFGATETLTFATKEEAVEAFKRGWTRYRPAPPSEAKGEKP